MSYLMESSTEGARLLAQGQRSPSHERLTAAGLGSGMRALDVGCGAGATLPAMLQLVGPGGSVTGVEPSSARAAEARALVAGHGVTIREAALPKLPLPDGAFDFVWSQYVFEYLREPRPALDELLRVTRSGGRVAVADIDGVGQQFWPVPPVVEAGQARFLRALAGTGFDLHVGRKLYSHFVAAGLQQVEVHLTPFYVVAGPADASLRADWEQRFEVLRPVAEPEFGSRRAYDDFAAGYLGMLDDPAALKYSVVLTTSGVKP